MHVTAHLASYFLSTERALVPFITPIISYTLLITRLTKNVFPESQEIHSPHRWGAGWGLASVILNRS